MKRYIFLLFIMLASVVGARAQEAYAVKSGDGKTLTFYYDNDRSSRRGTTYDLNMGTNIPGWAEGLSLDNPSTITSVVFDSTFANARPTTTYRWFYRCNHLTSIQGIQYLNTGNVTDMRTMFYNCSGLTSLDVSHFDTGNVTNMFGMFWGCVV